MANRKQSNTTQDQVQSPRPSSAKSKNATIFRSLLIFGGLLVITIVFSILIAQQTAKPTPLNATKFTSLTGKVELSPAAVEFGEVQAGTKATTTVQLINNSYHAIQVADIRTTCGCTVASVPTERIPPGGSADVEVRMSVDKKVGKKTSKSLTFVFEGSDDTLKLPVSVISINSTKDDAS